MFALTNLIYLFAAVLFILGLKLLGSAKTARRGNGYAMLGMLIAIVVTLFDQQIIDFTYIIIGIVIGAAIGAVAAMRVQMTAMPQMVALFNGFGGIASALVAYAEFGFVATGADPQINVIVTIVLSVLIGVVTFTGSLVAFAKLQGIMGGAPVVFKGQQALNALLVLLSLALGALMVLSMTGVTDAFDPYFPYLLLTIGGLAAILGVTSTIPIGGADMPVVIALLNSYSGIAASMTGFVISNNVLIISGALVGASGLILTKLMCDAMNRSLANVLFAAVGTADSTGTYAGTPKKNVTRYTAEDAAMVLDNAQSMIIVPGYGLAVSQAQHILQEVAQILQDKDMTVRFAIHPVAGRMPGHMNVLMAEANVSYDLLCEMDEINDDFQNTDVALIIGANDVVNPAARYQKDSPLYGMPILNCDHARTVMIVKRSLSPGFAGVDNELFYDDKTMMVFGDAKKIITELANVLKS